MTENELNELEAFRGSVSIEEVEINSSIEVIHARAFYECSGIRSLTFPDGLKKLMMRGSAWETYANKVGYTFAAE